jgi:hypothetical protein
MKFACSFQSYLGKELRCQFHQHFTDKFFVQMLFRQLFSSYMYVTCTWKKLPKQHSYKKHTRIKLMKLTVGLQIIFCSSLKIRAFCVTSIWVAKLDFYIIFVDIHNPS